jgi:hypothetical protein
MTPILAMLFACVTPDPPPPLPVATPPAPAQRIAKSKTTKAKGQDASPPIGVAGPGVVEMTVQSTETSTTSTLSVTFSDGSSRSFPLGTVPAKCTEVPAAPVTQGDRQVTPFYSFTCTTDKGSAMGHVAQIDDQLIVVQADPPRPGTTTPRLKVLKRFTLAPGVVLSRKG